MNKDIIIRKYWAIVIILLLLPFFLYFILQILPTHDDWVSTTSPDFNPLWIKERFLFYGYHWRPFDAIIGYINGLNPQVLFPSFNHYLVVIGHTICVLMIFKMLTVLKFNHTAVNIATLYCFIAPATMATVTAVDSMNQTYALIFDIIAFLFYIKKNRMRYIGWIMMIIIAAWWKENGLMWALICPILAYGFEFIDRKTLKKDLIIGIGIMITYALAIYLLPKQIIIHPEYVPDVFKIIKNFCKFFFTTFITVDYIFLLHQPSRNILLAAITFLFSVPFIYVVFVRNIPIFKSKKIICTIISLLIAVAPHLFTVYSMMHTYAGMALLAILIAYSLNHYYNIKSVLIAFILFFIVALCIDAHLIHASIQSGKVGKRMAIEAIHETLTPVKDTYVIIIEDDYPKLSSFCVIPNEAFGWGIAARYETNYQWPVTLQDTTIERSVDASIQARQLGREILSKKQSECIWIIDHENVEVIK